MTSISPSDRELLLAWRGGDPRCGRHLFERHYDGVARFFLDKVGLDSPDLVQRTFLGCLEKVDRSPGDSACPAEARSTQTTLDQWADALRAQVLEPDPQRP